MNRTIRILGWSTALCSMCLILSNIFDVMTNPMDQINTMVALLPQINHGMEAMTNMVHYSRWWSMYSICYFLFVFAGSIFFIRLQEIGRKILEIACWIGMINACIDSFLSYMLWQQMQTALSTLPGAFRMGIGNLNPWGIVTIILSFFLWIIPATFMIVFLRKPTLKVMMK